MRHRHFSLLVVLTTLLLSATPAAAQPECPTADCTGWGDINFLSGGCTGNDDAALQEAFCCLRDLGGTLVLPAGGLCVHTDDIEIKGGADFHIDGNGATLKTADSTATDQSTHGGIRIQESRNFSIRNLTLDGNRAYRPAPADVANHLLILRGVEDVEIENVHAVNSVADGFYLRSFEPSSTEQDLRRVRLIGCSSDNSWRHGLAIAAGEDIQILGGTFSNAHGAYSQETERFYSGGIRIETHAVGPEGGDEDDAIYDVLVQGTFIHGNEAMGIHLRAAPDQPVENIRILGNALSDNVRGQMLLHGRNVLVADNLLDGFTYHSEKSQVAGILVKEGAEGVVLEDNTFSSFLVGDLDVINVEDEVERFEARGNSFRDILLSSPGSDTSASAPTLIRTESAHSVISGNTFRTSDIRGILVSTEAPESVVADNSFVGMTLNVIYVNGLDTVLRGNRVAGPRGSASSAKAEAVVRVRADLGIAESNVVECADSSQRGFLFEESPVLVRDNLTEGCSSTVALEVEGTGTTYGLPDNHSYP